MVPCRQAHQRSGGQGQKRGGQGQSFAKRLQIHLPVEGRESDREAAGASGRHPPVRTEPEDPEGLPHQRVVPGDIYGQESACLREAIEEMVLLGQPLPTHAHGQGRQDHKTPLEWDPQLGNPKDQQRHPGRIQLDIPGLQSKGQGIQTLRYHPVHHLPAHR